MSVAATSHESVSPPYGYLARILAAAAVGAFRPGTIGDVWVAHDDGCPRLRNGPCTCAPDITITERDASGRPRRPGTWPRAT